MPNSKSRPPGTAPQKAAKDAPGMEGLRNETVALAKLRRQLDQRPKVPSQPEQPLLLATDGLLHESAVPEMSCSAPAGAQLPQPAKISAASALNINGSPPRPVPSVDLTKSRAQRKQPQVDPQHEPTVTIERAVFQSEIRSLEDRQRDLERELRGEKKACDDAERRAYCEQAERSALQSTLQMLSKRSLDDAERSKRATDDLAHENAVVRSLLHDVIHPLWENQTRLQAECVDQAKLLENMSAELRLQRAALSQSFGFFSEEIRTETDAAHLWQSRYDALHENNHELEEYAAELEDWGGEAEEEEMAHGHRYRSSLAAHDELEEKLRYQELVSQHYEESVQQMRQSRTEEARQDRASKRVSIMMGESSPAAGVQSPMRASQSFSSSSKERPSGSSRRSSTAAAGSRRRTTLGFLRKGSTPAAASSNGLGARTLSRFGFRG